MAKIKYINHHIIYERSGVGKHEQKPIQVPVYPAEHYICTQLQRRGSKVSRGFLKHLKFFIWAHEDMAVDLTKEMKKNDTKKRRQE